MSGPRTDPTAKPGAGAADREGPTLAAFCAALKAVEGRDARIVERPDRERPGERGCDAILLIDGKRTATEVTSIDAYLGRRADDDRFRRVILPLEVAVRRAFPNDYVEIGIASRAVPTGIRWDDLSRRLTNGVITELQNLAVSDRWETRLIRGIPFPVRMTRRKPGWKPACSVVRFSPDEDQRREELSLDIRRAFSSKSDTLAPYRASGLPTVLLIEWDDIALLNSTIVAEASSTVLRGFDTNVIDSVYLVDATRVPSWVYPVKLGRRAYPDLAEYHLYFETQCHLVYDDP